MPAYSPERVATQTVSSACRQSRRVAAEADAADVSAADAGAADASAADASAVAAGVVAGAKGVEMMRSFRPALGGDG